ncbi:hypothetical protein AVEN_271013-1, partial [Araneus ventricosus]
TVVEEEIASPAPVPSAGEDCMDTTHDSSTQLSKNKTSFDIYDLLRSFIQPFGTPNKQDPESLKFHHLVYPQLLPFDLPKEMQKTPEEKQGSELISLISEILDLVSSKEDEEVRSESADLVSSKEDEDCSSWFSFNRVSSIIKSA